MTVTIPLVWCLAISGVIIGIIIAIARRKRQDEFGAIFVLTFLVTSVACAIGGLYEHRKTQAFILEMSLQQEAVDKQERLDRINEMPQPWINLYHFILNESDASIRGVVVSDFTTREPPTITMEQFRLFTELDVGGGWQVNVWRLKPWVMFELPEVKKIVQLEGQYRGS